MKTYTETEVIELMKRAWDAGFKKYEMVEAGLESRETDAEVFSILQKHEMSKAIKEEFSKLNLK